MTAVGYVISLSVKDGKTERYYMFPIESNKKRPNKFALTKLGVTQGYVLCTLLV